MFCGKPMVFTYRDDDRESEEKPALREAFRNRYHPGCGRRYFL